MQPLAQHVAIRALAMPESYYEEVRAVYAERVGAMMDALATLPGAVMRSRHTQAMLLAMDLDELVARDEDDYVRLAVALGNDRARRDALRARVRERKHVLYRDRRVVEAFQRFLLDPSSLAV